MVISTGVEETGVLDHGTVFHVLDSVDNAEAITYSLTGFGQINAIPRVQDGVRVGGVGDSETGNSVRITSEKGDGKAIGLVMLALRFRGTTTRLVASRREVSTVTKDNGQITGI